MLRTATNWFMFVASALINHLTRFRVTARDIEYPSSLCGKLCVGIRAAQDALASRCAYTARALPCMARQPNVAAAPHRGNARAA